MATSVLMAANDHQTANPSLPLPQDHDHQPMRRSSGRRKPKGGDSSAGQKKKLPQRGMGVEKLERLRLQERLKKMTEISNTNQGFSVLGAAFADPTLINGTVPVQISKLGGFGPQMGLNQNQGFPGFHGQMGVNGGLGSDQLQTDLFGFGCLSNSGFVGKNVNGISKELSSTPNVIKCYSEHFNACHKKKKVNGENLKMYNIGDCGFLGLKLGDNHNVSNQENQALGARSPLAPQGVEVVAVHRRGSSGSEGGSLLMEYEFFPSGKGSETSSSSPSFSSAMAGFDASSCIDLSLKLSY